MSAFFRRDLLLFIKRPLMLFQSALFFMMAVIIYPFLLGPDPEQLGSLSVAIVLASFVFAGFVRFGQMFDEDYQDGSLRQIYITKKNFLSYMVARIISTYCFLFVPLIVVLFFMKELVYFPEVDTGFVVLVLVLISFGFVVLDAFFSSLSLFVKGNKFIFFILALPFFLPFVIFSALVFNAFLSGANTQGLFYVLLALNLICAPVFIAVGLWCLTHLIQKGQ